MAGSDQARPRRGRRGGFAGAIAAAAAALLPRAAAKGGGGGAGVADARAQGGIGAAAAAAGVVGGEGCEIATRALDLDSDLCVSCLSGCFLASTGGRRREEARARTESTEEGKRRSWARVRSGKGSGEIKQCREGGRLARAAAAHGSAVSLGA